MVARGECQQPSNSRRLATIDRMPRHFFPQLFISEPDPVSSPEPSPVPLIYSLRNEPVPVKEGHDIRRQRSIDEALDMPNKEPKVAMTASSSTNTEGKRVDSPADQTGKPQLASLMQQPQPRASKVSGIKAAFERTNRRVSNNTTKSSIASPTRKYQSISDEKIARLNEELEKERHLRQELEGRCRGLEEETEDLKDQLNKKDEYWREEMAKKMHKLRQENSDPSRGLHSFRNNGRLGDPQGLQRQLTDLKRSVSKSTRVETMVTADSTFKQEMESLAHEVQNWVVNNYRRARVTASAEELSARLVPLVNERQLERLKPIWANWRPENKIAVFQSTVAAINMDIFDAELLFGMPLQEEWAMSLRKTAQQMSTVLDPQQYNKWRATTLDTLRQSSAMSAGIDSATNTMAEYITSILDVLAGMPSSDSKRTSLQPIVRRTITLAHLFRIQRARFSIDLPPPRSAFDLQKMENISFDRDAGEGHPIDCATFPKVIKLGDENGENDSWQNVILKAKVVCGEA